jgi:hypothetical protein
MLDVEAKTRFESASEGLRSPFIVTRNRPNAKFDISILNALNLKMDTQIIRNLLQELNGYADDVH